MQISSTQHRNTRIIKRHVHKKPISAVRKIQFQIYTQKKTYPGAIAHPTTISPAQQNEEDTSPRRSPPVGGCRIPRRRPHLQHREEHSRGCRLLTQMRLCSETSSGVCVRFAIVRRMICRMRFVVMQRQCPETLLRNGDESTLGIAFRRLPLGLIGIESRAVFEDLKNGSISFRSVRCDFIGFNFDVLRLCDFFFIGA